jgi:outer membrane protein TolC
MPERLLPRVAAILALLGAWPVAARTEPPLERVTFEEAVRRAMERNPTVGEAAQAILRAQGFLDQAKSVFLPSLFGGVGTVVLDAARGFDGNVTQPRVQSAFNATLSYAFLDAARWAARSQAADQVGIARISAEETRRQVALGAAQMYLAVVAAQRQREIALRNLATAGALEDYARARLEAGQGSRLNHVRSTQELAAAEGQLQLAELALRQAQEALGVAIFADGPVDANGDPELKPAAPPSDDTWLMQRPDVRLFDAQLQAADRVVRLLEVRSPPEPSFSPHVTPPGSSSRRRPGAVFQPGS